MNLAVWLKLQGLERLDPILQQAGIDLDIISDLDDSDLQEMGLSLGDRKRLLKAISASPTSGAATASAHANSVRDDAATATNAERRQLTVMFCDLVGSTLLSTRLDPEDMRQVIGDYHRAIAAAVAPYEGHIAQFLGDGVLVYFGYPRAHEDDGQRAVRAGIAIQDVISRLRPHGDLQLQTRIGIASGLVVMGEIGAGTPAAEQSASGGTPNLAARLQSCAEPGQILVSGDTRRLLGVSFELQSLGLLELKGFNTAIAAWLVLGERSIASRFEEKHSQALTKLIGRDSEVAMLLERWSMARDGEGQVVLLSGEAGIGKSRISQTLRQRLSGEPFTTVLWQCSPYFVNSALYPVVQQIERDAQFVATDAPQDRAQKLELTWASAGLSSQVMGYLLKLMNLPSGERVPLRQTPQEVKVHTLEALIDGLKGLAQSEAVLLLVEDAHWIDPTTEELLALAIERLRQARVLILITSRPDYAPSWGSPAHLTRLALSRLGQRQSATLISTLTGGKGLPDEVVAQIVQKCDGIPLFVEELTKTVIESELLTETMTGFELKGPLLALAIPSTLQDSLMARLDKLAPAKEVAQVGAAIGREFSHRLLAATLSKMTEAGLREAIDALVHSELVFRSGVGPSALYTFKHALLRDIAYASMVKPQRALRHAQIAKAIELTEQETVAAQPELLAHHHQEASDHESAFTYWIKAGDLATSRQAILEAVKHYQAALALFLRLEPDQRPPETELKLQMKLGGVLSISEGYRSPTTKASFSRARELSINLGDFESYVAAASASQATLYAAGNFTGVLEMFSRVRFEDVATASPATRLEHLVSIGSPQFFLGRYAEAWCHLDTARKLADSEPVVHGHMVGGGFSRLVVRAYAARVRAYSGHLDDAVALANSGLDIAEEIGHAPTKAWACHVNAGLAILKGDWVAAERHARTCIDISERFDISTRLCLGMMYLGQVYIAKGETEKGIAHARKGYKVWSTVGGIFHCSEHAARIADGLLVAGCINEAAEFVGLGEQVQRDCEERFCEAELTRLRGRLLELDRDLSGAEDNYRRALAVAEAQGAKLFSLRAAVNLARLNNVQGRRAEAKATLEPIYEWFTEGFDFPDLIRAKTTLEALR